MRRAQPDKIVERGGKRGSRARERTREGLRTSGLCGTQHSSDGVALPRPTANDKTLLVIVVGDRCPEWEKLQREQARNEASIEAAVVDDVFGNAKPHVQVEQNRVGANGGCGEKDR